MFHHESLTPEKNFKMGLCREFQNICPAAETKLYCNSFTHSSYWWPLSGVSWEDGEATWRREVHRHRSLQRWISCNTFCWFPLPLSPVGMSDTHTSLLVPLQSPTNTQCWQFFCVKEPPNYVSSYTQYLPLSQCLKVGKGSWTQR